MNRISNCYSTRNYLKKRILVQGAGGNELQTPSIHQYVEELEPGPDTRGGTKDFFEMASNQPIMRMAFSRWTDPYAGI